MAEPREDDFLDDIEEAAAEEQEQAMAEITDEAAEIDALRAERDAFQDKFMRALADAENARKRAQKDRAEAENYGGSKLARDMLPVHDNLKRRRTGAVRGHRTDPARIAQRVLQARDYRD